MNDMDTLTAAYRINSLLTVCSLALKSEEAKTSEAPAAAADALEIAQSLLGRLIDHTEASERPVEKESVAQLVKCWKGGFTRLKRLVEAAGGDDPETDDFEQLVNQQEALGQRIGGSKPKSVADAAGMLEWVLADGDGSVFDPQHAQAQKAVVTFLRGLA